MAKVRCNKCGQFLKNPKKQTVGIIYYQHYCSPPTRDKTGKFKSPGMYKQLPYGFYKYFPKKVDLSWLYDKKSK